MVGRGGGRGRRMSTRAFPSSDTPPQGPTPPLSHPTFAPTPIPPLDHPTPAPTPTDVGSTNIAKVNHAVETFASDSTSARPHGTTGHDPPIVAPVVTRRRGPTRRSAEISRALGDPKIRVMFLRGRPVGKSGTYFRTTVAPWVRHPVSFPHNVRAFRLLPNSYIEAFWRRIEETFDLVQYVPRTREVGPSMPAPSDVSMAGGSQGHTTPIFSTTSTPSPDNPSTPTSARPLTDADRRTIERWIRGHYVDYRCGLCRDYYDLYETDEERMQHIPRGMPDDQWRFLIELWGKDEFKRKREQAKANRAKLKMKHTCGSQSYQSKRASIEETTGSPVNEVDFFIETHISKKTNTFLDNGSREAAAMMATIVKEHTNESGMCSLTYNEVVSQALGPPNKGREPLQGIATLPPKGPRVSSAEVERELERVRANNNDMSRRLEETQQEVASLRENIGVIVEDALREALRQLGHGPLTPPPSVSGQIPATTHRRKRSSRAP